MTTENLGYTVNRKGDSGKFEKVSKLFANPDGSYGNKKDGIELNLSGKYPDLLINGQRYGKTFLNTSKTSGVEYYLVKNEEEGDLFLFKDTPRPGAAKPAVGGYAKKGNFQARK